MDEPTTPFNCRIVSIWADAYGNAGVEIAWYGGPNFNLGDLKTITPGGRLILPTYRKKIGAKDIPSEIVEWCQKQKECNDHKSDAI